MTANTTPYHGKTIKQILVEQFYLRLAQYKSALKSGNKSDFINASVGIHTALCALPNPKRYRPLVRKAFRENYRPSPLAV